MLIIIYAVVFIGNFFLQIGTLITIYNYPCRCFSLVFLFKELALLLLLLLLLKEPTLAFFQSTWHFPLLQVNVKISCPTGHCFRQIALHFACWQKHGTFHFKNACFSSSFFLVASSLDLACSCFCPDIFKQINFFCLDGAIDLSSVCVFL